MEKVVKKTIKAEKKTEEKNAATNGTTVEIDVNNYTYEVTEDVDTRTGERIWLVKVAEKLSREEYIIVNKYIKSLGGYYSRFKHAFLFKDDPRQKLHISTEEKTEDIPIDESAPVSPETSTDEQKKEFISYEIIEDIHTKTNDKIWIVKTGEKLNKTDFAKVKQKFATIHGYYSSFKKGFIFKYDPTEKLKPA